MKTYIQQYRAARMAGTPIICLQTGDSLAAVTAIKAQSNEATPIVIWDVLRGWTPGNKAGEAAIASALDEFEGDTTTTVTATDCLVMAKRLPGQVPAGKMKAPGTVLFMHNAHRFLVPTDNADFSQALLNLRDEFKATQRTVILMGTQFDLPSELKQHILLIDEPLPTAEQLEEIVKRVTASAGQVMESETEQKAVKALRGIGAFAAEQTLAMNFTTNGLDIAGLWDRKKQLIRATPGLSVLDDGYKFGDIGGCEEIKDFARAILYGRKAPRCIVFLDEIEKALAGATGGTSDSSGVSQGIQGKMLSEMQDNKYTGMIFVGFPGAGKTAIAQTMGNEVGIPTITLDLGAVKNSLVGQSEAQMREAFKVIKAVSDGEALFVATCNKISGLAPEMRRRFTLGTWFFDLPTEEERAKIWEIWLANYGFTSDDRAGVDDTDWTGDEIRRCCDIGFRTGRSLLDAARKIVPVAKISADNVKQLRSEANNNYLSAAYEGTYKLRSATPKAAPVAPLETTRAFGNDI